MVIAIPSYPADKRGRLLQTSTLLALQEGGIPPKIIYIFVANQKEADKYKTHLIEHKNMYGKIVVGRKGAAQQRAFIMSYFPENQYVVSCDDDLQGMQALRTGQHKISKFEVVTDLYKLFKQAYIAMVDNKVHLWGVNTIANNMQPSISFGLHFAIGMLFGFINRRSTRFPHPCDVDGKEDYMFSFMNWAMDQKIMIFRFLSPIAAPVGAPGGIGSDRGQKNKKAADTLKYFSTHMSDLKPIPKKTREHLASVYENKVLIRDNTRRKDDVGTQILMQNMSEIPTSSRKINLDTHDWLTRPQAAVDRMFRARQMEQREAFPLSSRLKKHQVTLPRSLRFIVTELKNARGEAEKNAIVEELAENYDIDFDEAYKYLSYYFQLDKKIPENYGEFKPRVHDCKTDKIVTLDPDRHLDFGSYARKIKTSRLLDKKKQDLARYEKALKKQPPPTEDEMEILRDYANADNAEKDMILDEVADAYDVPVDVAKKSIRKALKDWI